MTAGAREPDTESSSPDPEPTAETPAVPAGHVPPVVVSRWVQLVLLPIAFLAAFAVARAAGTVVLVFVVAAVIALVLNPLVKRFEHAHLPHALSVLLAYLACLAIIVGVGILLINPISTQVASFQHGVPALTRSANKSLANLQNYLDDHGIGIHVKKQGQTALETLQKNVLRRSGDLVSFTRDFLQTIATGAFALILVLVISIYMLLYAEGIGRLTRRVMPPGDGSPADDYPLRVQKAVFSYVRGQLLFSIIMGTTSGVTLWIFGVLGIFPDGQTYALAFGVFFGVMELVPYLGPVLGALPPILVALFNDPISALWVGLLFLALQQLEGHVVAPQIFGSALRINPLLIIFALLLGGELYGIVGAFVALPLAAVARETLVYLRRHVVLEPIGPAPAALPCAACGARAQAGDEFCRRCGVKLADSVVPSAAWPSPPSSPRS
jgi:predicted PurR-regulated permease PerM